MTKVSRTAEPKKDSDEEQAGGPAAAESDDDDAGDEDDMVSIDGAKKNKSGKYEGDEEDEVMSVSQSEQSEMVNDEESVNDEETAAGD